MWNTVKNVGVDTGSKLLYDYIPFTYSIISISGLLNDLWHHACLEWRNTDGKVIVFSDGDLKSTMTDYRKDTIIEAGGIFIIGQEFDGYGSDFEEWQALVGKISQVELNVFLVICFKVRDNRVPALMRNKGVT